MERETYIYDGERFEEGELVLVNGEELMYCRFVSSWMGGDAMWTIFAPRFKLIHRYEPKGENPNATHFMRSTANGDKIEHVYDPSPYNVNWQPEPEPLITNGYLIDGWIICIILMIATLIFKPVGAWTLLVLGVWLKLRREEIQRIKDMKK